MQRTIPFAPMKPSNIACSILFLSVALAASATTSEELDGKPHQIGEATTSRFEFAETKQTRFSETKLFLDRSHQASLRAFRESFERIEITQMEISLSLQELTRRLDDRLEQQASKR
ncbi:hypothetical protein [Enterovibrio norvegicus]|uniref:hypothetical protein n=1 Tax=Enterovibrio norvegicus TaxID=188144 RepID=UPI000C84166C|nr:hypothetical protein [Enterovibrio norvegicus]PMN73759.1 hypothetical protein BCT27_01755 [Enterovibrio norvegicus]